MAPRFQQSFSYRLYPAQHKHKHIPIIGTKGALPISCPCTTVTSTTALLGVRESPKRQRRHHHLYETHPLGKPQSLRRRQKHLVAKAQHHIVRCPLGCLRQHLAEATSAPSSQLSARIHHHNQHHQQLEIAGRHCPSAVQSLTSLRDSKDLVATGPPSADPIGVRRPRSDPSALAFPLEQVDKPKARDSEHRSEPLGKWSRLQVNQGTGLRVLSAASYPSNPRRAISIFGGPDEVQNVCVGPQDPCSVPTSTEGRGAAPNSAHCVPLALRHNPLIRWKILPLSTYWGTLPDHWTLFTDCTGCQIPHSLNCGIPVLNELSPAYS